MPVYSCKYDPVRDLKKVSPTGALDLKAAFANNAVPANLESTDSKFNGIEDPASISTRVVDPIDAAVLEKSVRSYKAPKGDD